MSECEWNPVAKRPAFDDDAPHGEAVWSVGVDGKWHLCDGCAALPEFARYRKRRRLFRRAPPRVKRRANRVGRCGHLSPTAAFACSKPKGHKGPHQEIGVSETLSNQSGTWTDAECYACAECGCRIASPGLCGECSCEDCLRDLVKCNDGDNPMTQPNGNDQSKSSSSPSSPVSAPPEQAGAPSGLLPCRVDEMTPREFAIFKAALVEGSRIEHERAEQAGAPQADFAALASAMRKMLPPALLAEVVAHLDPVTPFVQFLRTHESQPQTKWEQLQAEGHHSLAHKYNDLTECPKCAEQAGATTGESK